MKKPKVEKSKKRKFRFLRIIAKIFAGIIIFLFLVVLFIRSPWGQGVIVDYAVNYVSDKTQTKVEIEKLFITFDGDIMLKGLYLEDKKGDTLIYSKWLEANVPLWPLIRGKGVGVDALDWEGVKANIIRKDSTDGYNFQFLIDAFVSTNSTSVKQDTTAAPMKIIIGDLNFKNIDLVYNDAVLGIESKFNIGILELEMKKIDLEKMDFRAWEAYLANSRIKYIQKPVPIDPNADPVPLPFLSIGEFSIKNVFAEYQSHGDRIAAKLDIFDLYAEIPMADLVNNTIEIGDFDLKNSIITIFTETENNAITEKTEEVVEIVKQDIETFEWPDFRIAIANLNLEENKFSYFVGNEEAKNGVFNPNAIVLNSFTFKGNDIFLRDKKAGLNIDAFTFKETSGFDLKNLALKLDATDKELEINNLNLFLNNNILEGRIRLEYPNLSDLFEAPEKSKIDLNFPSFQFDLNEVFKFRPELKQNEYLAKLSKKYIKGNVNASGYISSLQIPNANVFWGNSTKISAIGLVQNANDPKNLTFNIPQFSARTIRNDLIQFVNESELGISLPENISFRGNAKGNLEDFYTKAQLTTSQGIAFIDGHFRNDSQIAFDADLEIKEYKLNELLKNDQLGSLSLKLKTSGSGKNINNLDAQLVAEVSSFQFNKYQIKDLAIKGDIKNGKGNVVTEYKDKNLNMTLNADVVLDSIAPEVSVAVEVIGANLQSLGLMQRDVRAALKLNADFKGNSESYDVIATIGDGVVVADNKTYLLGDVLATALVRKDTTSIWLDNKLLHFEIESNTDPVSFSNAIQRHIASYFYRDTKVPDTLTNPVKLRAAGKIIEGPILKEVFLVNVKELDTVKIAVDFDEMARKLQANITAPHINYSENKIDSLAFSMDTDKEKFVFDLRFNNLKAGPLDIQRTKITGNQANNELALNFTAYNKDSTMINIQSQITGERDRLRFHVLPTDLLLNYSPWETPENNEIIYIEKKLEFNDFIFRRENQSVEITDKLSTISKDHVAIELENFELNEFLNYLNPNKKLAEGNLNGNLTFIEPFGAIGLLADINVQQFNVLNTELGTLTVDAKSLGGNSYDFNLALKEGNIDLDLTGDYAAAESGAKLNLDLEINEFKMKALEGFSQGEIIETDGSFSGKFQVSGTVAEPKYEGQLNFSNADFKIRKFNSAFTLASEQLSINNEGLSMDNFTIRDENGNTFVMSGKIGTESFLNPTFNLSVKADNFHVLNATEEDNDFLYGKLAFNADAHISGDLQIPKINMDLTVTEDTDVTYVMPSASINIEERDGVVIFVNRENPDAILTRIEEKSASVTGFDIGALLKIGKGAKVTVIIDQETGDNFEVYGDGDFNFTMNPNGRMGLSGVYEIAGGHYEMNLYKLVNRKFELAPGSRVSWSGDPFDANLDVRAIYKLEASASPLMAPQISGSDPAVKTKYRQVLPFLVYLNIDGELMRPKISFNLDMPEDEQGAIGGQVYGRVQQVNQQEDELNRQVFSLLVLNRFYPEPGSDGSRGGFATVARDNINDALSDQLNVFSDKLLGDTGVELDFGLDSYTDYQGEAPQNRTQLDIAAQKKLFNNRVVVRVGSEMDLEGSSSTGEATPIIGNVSLEYLLTENGRYRLKGFRRNEFENVIDGQTIISGIALIFTQEFNKFDELWEAILRGETVAEKEARKASREAKIKADAEAEETN